MFTTAELIILISSAVIFALIAFEGITFSLGLHEADCRNINHKDVLLDLFIPIVGRKKIASKADIFNEYLANRVLTLKGKLITIFKWVLLCFTLFFALNLALTLHQNFLIRVGGWFTLIIFEFVHSSVAATIADKKGMNKFIGALFGFVPFASVMYYCITRGKKRILPETVYQTYSFSDILGRVVIYGEMVVLSFVVLIPIIYLLGSSLSPVTNIPKEIWPANPTFNNFKILFEQKKIKLINGTETTINVYYWHWFKSTLIIAILTMIFSVLLITITAYIFGRFKFKGQKAGLLAMLILQMFPTFISLVAYYNLLKMLGMLNNPYVLVFIYTSGAIPYNVWLVKGFLQNIPRDLDESATIDGANRAQIFFKIIFPLILPIITFVAVSQFMSPWLDYVLPSYILDGGTEQKDYTLAVGLFKFINDQTNSLYQPTLFCAGSLFIALPITVLYVIFQKSLIEGVTAGATKG